MSLGTSLPSRIAESSGTVFYCGGAGASDANPGTAGSPWATAQHAVDTLTSGQKCLFRTGTYTGVKIYHKANAATITLEADTGAAVKFTGTQAGADGVIDYWDSQNWRIRNIEVDATGAKFGVNVIGTTLDTNGFCQHLELYGLDVHDASFQNAGTLGLAGIFINGNAVTDIQVWNTKSHRNARRATTTAGISSGAVTIPIDQALDIPASGTLWMPDHTTISYTAVSGGNTLTGVTGVTKAWPSGTPMFAKSNASPYTLDHGAYVHTTKGTGAPDVLFANSIFHDNIGWGIQNYPTALNAWAVNCVLAYNFNGAGMNYAQDAANGTMGCRTVNCISFHNDDGAQLGTHAGGYDIFFVTSGDSTLNHIDSCIGYQNGGAATGFNFAADNAGATHTNKIESDPLFNSPGTDASNRDFTLKAGSPALAAGVAAYTPTFDYTGAQRVNADIGPFMRGLGRQSISPSEAPKIAPSEGGRGR